MPHLTELVEIHDSPHPRFAEPGDDRAARLAAMWTRAAEMFREPELFRQILDELDEGVCFTGRGDRVLYWNHAAEVMSGYAGAEIVGHDLSGELLRESRRQGCERCGQGCPARVTARGRTLRRAGLFLRHKQGHWLRIHMRKSPMLDGRGRVVGEVRLFRPANDTLTCVEHLAALRQPALLDRLTGLGNRRFLEGSLAEALTRMEHQGRRFGVLLADLDGLADVNWIRGQAAGDAALRVIASSIAAALRRFDLLARWGDSTFAVLIEGIEAPALPCLAARLCELAASSRVRDDAGEFSVTVSAGACLAVQGDTPATLIQRAERHLHTAKAQGRGLVSAG